MASKKLSSDTSLANSYKLSRGVASVARPSAPTIGTATDGGYGAMSVTFTASTLGPSATSYTLTSSSGVTGTGASSPLTLQEAVEGTYTYSVSGVNANGTGPSSAASNSVVVASVDTSAYFPIQTTTLASSAASITFSSIPATYTHLQLRITAQSSRATYAIDNGYIQFNSDTASNYAYHYIDGEGTSVSPGSALTQTFIQPGDRVIGTSVSPGTWGSLVIDILDYANTSKYKTTRTLSGCDTNGLVAGFAGMINIASGLWQSTSAINSIKFAAFNGNLTQYTTATLYGLKG